MGLLRGRKGLVFHKYSMIFRQILRHVQSSPSYIPLESLMCVLIFLRKLTSLRNCVLSRWGVTLSTQPGSSTENSIRDFLTYGTPLELPENSADIHVDAPAGLGGRLAGAAISLQPHGDSKTNAPELRLLLLDNKSSVIDELMLERDYISFGSANEGAVTGAETKLKDSTGVLTLTLRSNFQRQNPDLDISFHIAGPQKKLAVDVLPTMRFLANFKNAHSLVVAPRFGPIPFSAAVNTEGVSEDFLEQNSRWYELTNSLVRIQEKAPFGISFPDLSKARPEW